jgi:uncharacterized membrane protein
MRLWVPILLTPVVTLAQQTVNYALVPLACMKQQHAPLHVVAAVALGIALAGIAMAWSAWREAGLQAPDDAAQSSSRERLLAAMGVVISALMALTIVAQWLTTAFIPPCAS